MTSVEALDLTAQEIYYLHSSVEKSLMERVNQYFKDRIESFDIIIHVCKNVNVIYFTYIIGYNSL